MEFGRRFYEFEDCEGVPMASDRQASRSSDRDILMGMERGRAAGTGGLGAFEV